MSEKCFLGRLAVVLRDESACVRWAADQLSDYLRDMTGESPSEDASGADSVIEVSTGLSGDPQSYSLSLRPGTPHTISVSGSDPLGAKFGLIDLIREIRFDDRKAWLPDDLNRSEKPHYGLRGMYAHLHWQYGHPYALRTWSLQDWKRYVDLLAVMKANLFQIWTMAAICPNPLSSADEAYLLKLREVVRYAREVHGMEVWPGECGANVAESDFGMPIEHREYWQVEVMKDPALDEFQVVMDNRANMYRLVNNGDGYWVIDSDPGRYKGSPASEFANIMAGNRRLIDGLTEKGDDAKLVYWVWMSWGTGERPQNWREAIEGIRTKVREPWWLLACWPEHLELIAEMSLIHKSVFFPYALVEPEPSNPFTHVKYAEIADQFALAARYPGLQGAMGNAQTPLAQLPNIFRLLECAWDTNAAAAPARETLQELGRLIFPAVGAQLADGWLALGVPGSDVAFSAGSSLDRIAAMEEAGVPGPLGRHLFPDPMLIVRDLGLLLRIHGFAEKAREAVDEHSVQDALFGYLNGVLEWQRRTGFHGCRVDGVDFQGGGTLLYGADYNTVVGVVRQHAALKERSGEIRKRLEDQGFDKPMCERAVYEAILVPLGG